MRYIPFDDCWPNPKLELSFPMFDPDAIWKQRTANTVFATKKTIKDIQTEIAERHGSLERLGFRVIESPLMDDGTAIVNGEFMDFRKPSPAPTSQGDGE